MVIASAAAATFAASPAPAADDTLRDVTPGGTPVELVVRDTASGTCLTVRVGEETARRTAPCFPSPAGAGADATGVHVTYRGTPEKLTIVHGVLSAETAVLQLRFGDGRLVEVKPEGPARAYLAVFRGRPPLASTRGVGADGRDRAAADLDPRALRVEPRRGPITLGRTRDERGGRARFQAFTTPLLRPGTLRRRRATCVSVSSVRGIPRSNVEPGYSGGSACTFERTRIALRYAAGCADRRLLLFGLAPRAVTRFEIVTSRGTRLRADTFRFPRSLRRSGRGFVFSRRDPGPLRRLEAYARGRRIASLPLTSVGAACGSSSRS